MGMLRSNISKPMTTPNEEQKERCGSGSAAPSAWRSAANLVRPVVVTLYQKPFSKEDYNMALDDLCVETRVLDIRPERWLAVLEAIY